MTSKEPTASSSTRQEKNSSRLRRLARWVILGMDPDAAITTLTAQLRDVSGNTTGD